MSRASAIDEALAQTYRPLLVLYPEIDADERQLEEDWRERRIAPLRQDYHPRDVRLVLDHAVLPRKRFPHSAERLLDEVDELLARGRKAGQIDLDLVRGADHGDRDRFWAEYCQIVKKRAGHAHADYPHRAYVNLVRGEALDAFALDRGWNPFGDLVAVQYWFIYLYNDWKAPHEGDWEHVDVILRRSGAAEEFAPLACAYSAHHGGYRLPWRRVERADDEGNRAADGNHPIVYVANGSHANYFRGERRFVTTTRAFGQKVKVGDFPFSGEFTDFTISFEEGQRVFPDTAVIPAPDNGRVDPRWSGDWRWLNIGGRWGWDGALKQHFRWLPLADLTWSGPLGLPGRRTWINPFEWAESECDDPEEFWLLRL